MKTKEFKSLRAKSTKELQKLLSEKKLTFKKESMSLFAGKNKNLKLATNLRREIAKILTLIREKEILEKLEKKGKELI